MNLWVVFITGLTVGGLSCLAIQGGLLASVITAREESDLEEDGELSSKERRKIKYTKENLPESGKDKRHTMLPTFSFLTAKLIAYAIVGFLLGLFGSILKISDTFRVTIQILSGLYMLVIALNLLEVHPIFRYAVIQPPKFLTKKIRGQAKSRDIFAPALLGAMTIFIPCGTTLAMEAYAISSGNPVLGMLTMVVFILGTTPLFLGIGAVTTKLGDVYKKRFFKFAAFALIYLGFTTVNAGLVLAGSPLSFQSLKDLIVVNNDQDTNKLFDSVTDGPQSFNIQVTSGGYYPGRIQVKAGNPVKLNLITNKNYACTSVFVIPQLGISKTLPSTGTTTIEFTPTQKGSLTYTCSMGMYRGVIEVI